MDDEADDCDDWSGADIGIDWVSGEAEAPGGVDSEVESSDGMASEAVGRGVIGNTDSGGEGGVVTDDAGDRSNTSSRVFMFLMILSILRSIFAISFAFGWATSGSSHLSPSLYICLHRWWTLSLFSANKGFSPLPRELQTAHRVCPPPFWRNEWVSKLCFFTTSLSSFFMSRFEP